MRVFAQDAKTGEAKSEKGAHIIASAFGFREESRSIPAEAL
jgi:hypothetical protein